MKKLIVTLVSLLGASGAYADASYFDMFVGAEGGVSLMSYSNPDEETSSNINMLLSAGASMGIKLGSTSNLYRYGFSTLVDGGRSIFPDFDDKHVSNWGAVIMFDNYIRMQRSWRRSLIFSGGYGFRDMNSGDLEPVYIASFAWTERTDANLDVVSAVRLFMPDDRDAGIDFALRIGLRYNF